MTQVLSLNYKEKPADHPLERRPSPPKIEIKVPMCLVFVFGLSMLLGARVSILPSQGRQRTAEKDSNSLVPGSNAEPLTISFGHLAGASFQHRANEHLDTLSHKQVSAELLVAKPIQSNAEDNVHTWQAQQAAMLNELERVWESSQYKTLHL